MSSPPFPAYRACRREAERARSPSLSSASTTIRHAFASHALASGLTAHAVVAVLGHTAEACAHHSCEYETRPVCTQVRQAMHQTAAPGTCPPYLWRLDSSGPANFSDCGQAMLKRPELVSGCAPRRSRVESGSRSPTKPRTER